MTQDSRGALATPGDARPRASAPKDARLQASVPETARVPGATNATPAVSVIIPVYNQAKYLPEAVECVFAQEFRDYELILVDDGSTDGSGELCDEFARQDARVRVIHQENGGAAVARNVGIEAARGAWIAFIDSDDIVGPSYLRILHEAATSSDASIAMAAHVRFSDAPPPGLMNSSAQTEVIRGRTACTKFYILGSFNYEVVTASLRRRELYDTLRFPEGRTREDSFIAHEMLWPQERVAVCHGCVYGYRSNPDGVMARPTGRESFDSLDAFAARVAYFERVGDEELADISRKALGNWQAQTVGTLLLDGNDEVIPERWRMDTGEVLRKLAQERKYPWAELLMTKLVLKLRSEE